MKNIYNMLISMKVMGILIMIFAIVIATATFIENDYGAIAAKAAVFNAKWFELLLLLLGINLVGNIFKYRLMRAEKMAQFIFHISFIIILIGAAITRFISYEGIMHIREGESSNLIISQEEYLKIESDSNNFYKKLLMSGITNNSFNTTININSKDLNIEYINFIPYATKELIEDDKSSAKLVLVTADQARGRVTNFLSQGESKVVSGISINFKADDDISNDNFSALVLKKVEDGVEFKSAKEVKYFDIGTQNSGVLEANKWHPFALMRVHSIGSSSLVVQNYYQNAKVIYKEGKPKSGMPHALKLKISIDDKVNFVTLFGQSGIVSTPTNITLNGINFKISYGSRYRILPFSLELKDFILERYKGSNSPSSYASEVVLIDNEQNIKKPFRIFMNNILNHRGYRFYQSSYDQDEKGTVLSVNHDYYGTLVTYIGYFLMLVGMIWALLSEHSRYTNLSNKLKKLKMSMLFILLFVSMNTLKADSGVDVLNKFDINHSKNFGKLLVQGGDGRVVPVNTLAYKIVNKLTRKDSIYNLHPTQILLGMMSRPQQWQHIKMIKVSHPALKTLLGDANRKNFAFFEFFKGNYLLQKDVENAMRKAPKNRDKYDKDILSVDERVNIAYMIYTGAIFKIFPDEHKHGWVDPISAMQSTNSELSMPSKEIFTQYFFSIDKAIKSGDWSIADEKLQIIKDFQIKYAPKLILSQNRIDMEILYYEFNIFKNLIGYFLIIGLMLLFTQIFMILKGKNSSLTFIKITMGLLIVGFIAQTIGLGLRWYIAGHAPWSNAYESMVYISWATLLAGFLYSKKSAIALSATAILSGLILFVAHLSWMDPQITNLVPVLKSYWLTIHVAVITASYGFLGLGALLSIINLVFMILENRDNTQHISSKIKELTYINEKSLLVGLILLTIGNFLGGVWANESWGRYWGWDPKETWALVTILVYSFILHMRFIPALNSMYAFNVASLFGYSSVIMTYFGVNFYLSGMHSYAKGDPVPVPDFVYISIIIAILLAIVAKTKYNKLNS